MERTTKNKAVTRLHRHVRSALERSGLTSGKLLVVAVSGGPDSLALLYSLHSLKDELGLRLHGAHLNHKLRGDASDSDARFAAETFRGLGIAFTLEEADVAAFRQQHKLSLEEAAREVRYAFLARVAAEQHADAIALGHTSDDQAETVLMHIIRGSGLTGLRGMETVTRRVFDGKETALIRPMLQVSRKETLAYCRALELEPRQDESNLSLEFGRNRVRLELIPMLEQYNPAVRDALVRLSHSASQDMAYIQGQVDKVWRDVVSETQNCVTLNKNAFARLEPAIQGHLLRRAVSHAKGDLEDVEQNHVDDMARLMTGRAGRSLDLPGGLRFSVGYAEATLAPAEQDPCPLPPLDGEHR
ncbi:MAG: tRNA lysidine(34) synthetase TilS, partial [Chloroflexi bacterium]|nr:tRNA lysidine(34) synthetase TilS [Chloroflexota bacterium]